MNDCPASDYNPEDAYFVHEARFIEGKAREKIWPATILVENSPQ